MKYLQNLHTHSTYCDGKDSLEDTVKKAISLGFNGIGFSGHAPMPDFIPANYTMKKSDVALYCREIEQLKIKYDGIIDIFCGIEFDTLSEADLSAFDYVIGSVHYLKKNNAYLDFDLGINEVRKIIDEYFNGNGMQFAKEYYEALARMPERVVPDIVGHFDIIAKHAEKHNLFDIESAEYKNYALEALHALSSVCNTFELNTGGIHRGYRLTPYPQKFILEEMNRLGSRIVMTSDCHNNANLNAGFDEGLKLLDECGFKEVYVLTKNGFEGKKINSDI